MRRESFTTIISNGGFAGQSFNINLGPAQSDVIDVLLSASGGTNASMLQENAPVSLISTGSLNNPKEVDLSLVEDNGRLFFVSVQNDDLNTNSLTFISSTSSGNINGESELVVTYPGDYVFAYTVNGWRVQALYTPDEKSNLELDMEFKAAQLSNYKTLAYTGANLTSINVYVDNTLTELLFSKVLSYTGSRLIQTVLTRICDGAIVTKNFTYTGSNLTAVETIG